MFGIQCFSPWKTSRRAILGAVLATAPFVSACKITEPHWCLEMEYGDCHSGGATEIPDSVRVIGFPRDRVDSLNQGHLHIGESVTLNLLVLLNAQHYPGDTSHSATWALLNGTTSARLTNSGNGVGTLTAAALGTIDLVLVNGTPRPVWAYSNLTVVKLSRIVIEP
jgi:hypothetical protein